MLLKKVKNFRLPGTTNTQFELQKCRGKYLVLFFYPKDATPGCTKEAQDFSQLYEQFLKSQTEVYGVSKDSVESHERFKSKQGYKIELLSDSDEVACEIFDVIKNKSMFGKKYKGIERSTFVIDKNGVLIQEWRKVKVADHAKKVLEFIQSS